MFIEVDLDLRNNRISQEGAHILASGLKVNKGLTVLDLQWNSIGTVGGKSLLDALEKNRRLQKLHLSGNDVDYSLLQKIENLLSRNRDLHADNEKERYLSEKLQKEIANFQESQNV